MDFINKLNQIVEDLRKKPQFKVAHFKIFDANESLIQKVEQTLGYTLEKPITDFYKSCNGIQLIWLDDYNEDFDEIENEIKNSILNDEFFIAQNNNFEPDGCIWIPSIEKVFLSNPYGNFDFDTNKLNPQIKNHSKNLQLRILDWFSAYNDISFLLNETSSPYLIMGKDHQATYSESHFITFELYLELLLKSKGDIQIRTEIMDLYQSKSHLKMITQKDIDNIQI